MRGAGVDRGGTHACARPRRRSPGWPAPESPHRRVSPRQRPGTCLARSRADRSRTTGKDGVSMKATTKPRTGFDPPRLLVSSAPPGSVVELEVFRLEHAKQGGI